MDGSTQSTISVSLDGQKIAINRKLYTELFDNSVVYGLAPYQHSLENGTISFKNFVELARKADIPYALFLSPSTLVLAHIKRKNDLIVEGVSKHAFSMNSRGSVQLRDIELIIKDILRKQAILKKHSPELELNKILGSLVKHSKLSVEEQANKLRALLDIDLAYIQAHNKEKAFQHIVEKLEEAQVFVSQSSRGYMPQTIQDHVHFSGTCVKDKKIPFIFLNNRDESKSFEPKGRKVLTLVLLAVCLAKAQFSPISYDEQSKDVIADVTFQIAEEILIPRKALGDVSCESLEDINKFADAFCVTPSAFIMRLRRLSLIDDKKATEYMKILQDRFSALPKPQMSSPKPTTAVQKYNGTAYSKAVLELMDTKVITKADARRILLLNKQPTSFLEALRGSL